MNPQATHRTAAVLMAGAAALAIAGFTALGSVFDYPQILAEPTTEILDAYRPHQGAVTFWFLMLVVGAALLAPLGVLLGRVAGGTAGRWIARLGIAAAAVQVTGLSRWVLFVPGLAEDAAVPTRAADARQTFELLHTWLGTALGETVGYALTATFTVLVVRAIIRPPTTNSMPTNSMQTPAVTRWMTRLGHASAGLVAVGVVIPLGVPGADLANFAGYVLWCLWLIAMAVVLWRRHPVAYRPMRQGIRSGTVS